MKEKNYKNVIVNFDNYFNDNSFNYIYLEKNKIIYKYQIKNNFLTYLLYMLKK